MRLSKTTKAGLKFLLKDSIKWMLIYGAAGVAIYFAIVLFIVDLVDVKLIVSLLIVEIPLAVILSIMLGEGRRNRLQDAIEHVRAVREFAHLRIHVFGNRLLVKWYYVENTNTKHAYNPNSYYIALAQNGIIDVIDHDSEDKMHEYFKANGISFDDRPPKSTELI